MENIKIKISTDFSATPGARYYTDGPNSGQEFFDKVLCKKMKEAVDNNVKLEIDFDGVFGPPSSFLSESFGRLKKEYPNDYEKRLVIISSEDTSIEKVINFLVSKYE